MHRKYPRRGLKKKMHAAYMNVFPALLGAYIDRLGAVPSKNYNPLPLVFVCGTLNYASAGADSGRKKTTNPRTHQPRQPVQRRQYESTMGPASQTAKHVKHTATNPLAHPSSDRLNHQHSGTTAYPPTTCCSNRAVPVRTQHLIVERAGSGPMGRVHIYI